MKKKMMALLLAGSMTALLFTGCGTYTDSPKSNNDAAEDTNTADNNKDVQSDEGATDKEMADTLNIAGSVAITMNQFLSQASNDFDIFYLTMSTLIRLYDGKIEMDAAEDYTISEDGLTYTFTLRDGLTYSDGTPITSADFAYAFKQLISPDSGSANVYLYLGVVGARDYNMGEGDWESVGIDCPDDKTIVLTLEQKDGSFINVLANYGFYPITEEFVSQWGDSLGTSPESILYSGPYILTEWTVDTSMTLEKNDSWWNAENEFPMKTVNILQIDSDNTEVSMFENGEADIISVLNPDYASTVSDYVDTYVGNTEMLLWMNESGKSDATAKLMKNENFRKALTYALDRETICPAVNAGFIGTNRAVSANYPGISDYYVNEYAVDTSPVKGDAGEAVKYLNAAMEELGYSDVSELPEVAYVSFERADIKLLGETVTDAWKQVLGIDNITFTQYPIGAAIQQFYTGDYDIFMISVGCTVSPTDTIKGFEPGGDYSFFTTAWDTDIIDLLSEVNALEFQSDEYFKKVAELETVFLNEYAIVPLYNQTFYYALSDKVEGFVEPGVSFAYQINHLTVSK